MIIIQKIRRLEDDSYIAWYEGDEERGKHIDSIIFQLSSENERRLKAAKARFESFDSKTQDSAWLNASQTSVSMSGNAPTFSSLGALALQMCEFWEMAANSAQDLIDFR